MPRNQLLQMRRGTAAAWTSANPVLAAGEPGLETDTNKVKYGDGTTAWTTLDYASASGGFDPDTYRGDYDPAAAYAAGDSVLYDGQVYVTAAGAPASGVTTPTFVASKEYGTSTFNAASIIGVSFAAGELQEGDLIILCMTHRQDNVLTSYPTPLGRWTLLYSHATFYGNGTDHYLTTVATAADAASGLSINDRSYYAGALTVRVYRNAVITQSRVQSANPGQVTSYALPAGVKTEPVGNCLTVTLFNAYGGPATLSVSSGVNNNTDGLTTTAYTGTKSIGFDAPSTAASTAWNTPTIAISASSAVASWAQFELGLTAVAPDPTYWTVSETLTTLLVPKPALLASTQYNPASVTSVTSNSATFADLDATNLTVTFTVPASGAVLVSLTAHYLTASQGSKGQWAVGEAGTVVAGTEGHVGGASSDSGRHIHRVKITGLTPGASITYRWMHAQVQTGTLTTRYGGTGLDSEGPALMEVWAA